MYKKDKVAPLNLPLPFIWALSPFFPSGAPHTRLPRGRRDPAASQGLWRQRRCSVSPAFPAIGFTGAERGGPRSAAGGQGSCLRAGMCSFFRSQFPRCDHPPEAGATDIEAHGLGFEPKGLPSWGDWHPPLPAAAFQFLPNSPPQAGVGQGSPRALLSGGQAPFKEGTAACHFGFCCSLAVSPVPLNWRHFPFSLRLAGRVALGKTY